MAASETIYTVATSLPVILCRGRAQVSRLAVYLSGVLTAPTAGTYTLVSPLGSTVATYACTISSSVAQAAILQADLPSTVSYGEGYSEQWDLTIGGIVRSYRRQAVIGRFELAPPLGQYQLIYEDYPDLSVNYGDYSAYLATMIEGQWNECLRYLWRKGTPADVLVDASDLYEWFRHAALERCFRFLLGMQENQRFVMLHGEHKALAERAKAGLSIQVDLNRDGDVDSLDRIAIATPVQINPAPSRRISRQWRY